MNDEIQSSQLISTSQSYVARVHGNTNDLLPVLTGNEQDLSPQTLYTCLFYQACKVHDIVCFGD